MRKITKIILHCSDSDNPDHDSVHIIKDWHVNGNGWSDIGYHFVIRKMHWGKIEFGRPIKRPGAHVKGHNKNSIGICLTGRKNFSHSQIDACRALVNSFLAIFNLKKSDVLGHGELDPKKTCPNFDMDAFRESL